uniref:Uncharacterized protein n=2 Tax=Auxenochlorella protothecoides TaxID=3075 RepID=A0A1D1ZZ12_AUXPR
MGTRLRLWQSPRCAVDAGLAPSRPQTVPPLRATPPPQRVPLTQKGQPIDQPRSHAPFGGPPKRAHLPTTMFTPMEDLPPDGEVLTFKEQTCNAETQECPTPMFVWEVKCKCCFGTGFSRSQTHASTSRHRRGRGGARRAALITCTSCAGLGYVRHASATPDDTLEEAFVTLGRDRPGPEDKARPWRPPSLAKAISAVNVVAKLYNSLKQPTPPM